MLWVRKRGTAHYEDMFLGFTSLPTPHILGFMIRPKKGLRPTTWDRLKNLYSDFLKDEELFCLKLDFF